MKEQYCPECGHRNPGDARFCMACGHEIGELQFNSHDWGENKVNGGAPFNTAAGSGQGATGRAIASGTSSGGTDWAEIAAAGLAILSLRHMSRKARQTAIVIAFLVMFFGCPMACGTVMFIVESITQLFR